MAHGSSHKKTIIITAIATVAIITLYLSLGGEPYRGDIYELSLVKNEGVNCKVWGSTIEIGTNGKRRPYSPLTVNFQPYINFEVISTSSTIGTLSAVDTSVHVSCSPVVTISSFDLVGGTVSTQFYATQQNGQKTFIKKVDRTLTTIPHSVLNKAQILPSGTVSASEIDSKLTSTAEKYTTRIFAIVSMELRFKGSSTASLINTANPIITQDIPATIFNEIKDPVQSISNEVRLINAISEQTRLNQIDIAKHTSTIAIEVTGRLPQWSSGEGSPFIEIYRPNGAPYGKFLMTFPKLVSSSTNTYEFKADNIVIGSKPEKGTWQIFMHSNKDIRKLSNGQPSVDVITFTVVDSTPTSPTPPTIPPPTPEPEPEPTPQNVFGLSAYYAYEENYDGAQLNGETKQKEEFPVTVTPALQFLGLEPSVVDKKFVQLKATPVIDLGEQNFQFQNINFKTEIKAGKITDENNDPTFDKTVSASSIKVNRKDGNFFKIFFVDVRETDIANAFKSIDGKQTLADGDKIIMKISTTGTTDGIANDGKRYKISIEKLDFIQTYTYVSQLPEEDPCKGLSGEALISCKSNNPNYCVDFIANPDDDNCEIKETQTGGTCEGLTPEECLKKGKDQECISSIENFLQCLSNEKKESGINGDDEKPKGESGANGICEGYETIIQCITDVNKLLGAGGDGAPTFSGQSLAELSNVLLYIGILFVVVIIIAVAIKLARR